MTGEQTEAIEHAALAGRDHHWRRFVAKILAAGALFVAVLLAAVVYQFATTSDLRGQVSALTGQQNLTAHDAQQLAQQIRGMGATPVVQPPSVGPQGPAGPGPSQQQIDDSVNRYFADHPPGATPAMVAVQVAEYLTAHPPVTQDQITTAASDFLAAHPQLFRGPTGSTGPSGPAGQNATDEQVASAVTAFCSMHNGCVGPAGQSGKDGSQGVQGVSVTDLQFARDSSGNCQVVITLHDPATGSDATITHPAGAAACKIIPSGPGG